MKTNKSIHLFYLVFFFVIGTYGQKEINPYNPMPKMEILKTKKGKNVQNMHFLVFGDSKGSRHFPNVLKRADSLQPDFCITTADLVNVGGGERGKVDYKKLDQAGGWFMRKYAMWPTVGNHEEAGGDDGVKNFTNFYGIEKDMYSFEYGNAKFIALPWPKIDKDKKKMKWLKNELKSAKGKHIFVFQHRPYYTLGNKSYKDVKGAETSVTKLFDKYNVTAVFSGHDHIYYRTKRNNTNYIISAGAGASIYSLNREKDTISGDVYYGKRTSKESRELKSISGILNNSSDYVNTEIVITSITENGNKINIEATNKSKAVPYKFHAADGTITNIKEAMYYVLSVKIEGDKVAIEMIDGKTGKVWDKAIIK